MISNEILLKLIKAFKQGDSKAVDIITKELIETYENRGYHQVSKKLREIRSIPNTKPSSLQPSSVQNAQGNKTLYELRSSKVALKDIVLSKNNFQLFDDIKNIYSHRELFKEHGIPNENRILLFGPPGTGKTLFAYVLAGELGLPVLHVYIDVLISSYLGETGRNIRTIFHEAENKECIIFLDEFDAIAKKRDDDRELGELKRSVAVLLQNIDDLNPNQILVAATNHDHLLDKAIRRRFTYELNLDILDKEGRKELIKLYLKNYKKIDYDFLANISEGLSGAYIYQSVNKALRKWFLMDQKDDLLTLILESMILQNLIKVKFDTKDKDKVALLANTINKLREHDAKKYTYSYLESIFNIPDSTIQNLVTKYANQ